MLFMTQQNKVNLSLPSELPINHDATVAMAIIETTARIHKYRGSVYVCVSACMYIT